MNIEKTVEREYILGPNTAGLAQRMYNSNERKPLNILERNYVLSCTVNQY